MSAVSSKSIELKDMAALAKYSGCDSLCIQIPPLILDQDVLETLTTASDSLGMSINVITGSNFAVSILVSGTLQ